MKGIISLFCTLLALSIYAQDSTLNQSVTTDFSALYKIRSPKFRLSQEATSRWVKEHPSLENITIEEILPYRSGLLIIENGTGRIFYTDSSGTVSRMDETRHGGDRYGAFNFVYNDTIYSIGGYGFWHITGAVRFFNTKTKEWNIVRTTQNVKVANGVNALFIYSEKEKKIFVLYKKYEDEYVITEKNETEDRKIFVQIFDLTTKDWSANTYTLNKKIAADFHDIIHLTSNSRSLFISSKNFIKIIELDLLNNEFYEADDQLNDEWVELNRKSPIRASYASDTSIIIYDLEANKQHSIQTKPVNRKKIGQLYDQSSILSEFPFEWIVIISLCITNLFLFFGFLNLYKQKKKQRLVDEVNSNATDQLVAKVKSFTDLLDETETKVVYHLLKNVKEGKLTSIDEINKILGIEKRSYKIKNNMRADVLKLINKKFMDFASSSDELIIRERSSFDKRYFEYTLNDRYANKIGTAISNL